MSFSPYYKCQQENGIALTLDIKGFWRDCVGIEPTELGTQVPKVLKLSMGGYLQYLIGTESAL